MRKRHIVLLILIFVAIGFFIIAKHASKSIHKPVVKAIVSFDGNLIPGQQQDFIFYTFLADSLKPLSMIDMFAKLELQTKKNNKIEEHSLLSPIKTKNTGVGKATFDIPSNALPNKGKLSLVNKDLSTLIDFENELKPGLNPSVLVIPPKNITLTGEHLQFRLLTFCPKTGKLLPRIPIRVQMFSSSDMMTVNRVIHSDMSGKASFSTHINHDAPEGLYKVEFSIANKRQTFKIQILSRKHIAKLSTSHIDMSNADSLSAQILTPVARSPHPRLKAAYQLRADMPASQLTDFTIDENNLHFKYNSNNSHLRQIEVWQNGKIHFISALSLTSGHSSLRLPESITPWRPASLRLLCAKENLINISIQSFIKKEQGADVQGFLTKSVNYLSNRQHQLMNKLLNPDSELWFIGRGFTSDFSSEFFSQINIEPVKAQLTAFPAVELQNKAGIMLKKSPQDYTSNRIVLVDKELDMTKIPVKSLKIWLSPQLFYDNLIANLYSTHTTANSLAAEIEARTLNYELLEIPEQSSEIERLEGLLLPMSEVIIYLKRKQNVSEPHFNIYLRAAKRLGNIIQLPEQISQFALSFKCNNNLIGPAPPVLREELDISKLSNSLRPGGNVQLTSTAGITMINLSGDSVSYNLSSQTSQSQQLTKLVNLRTYPIVVELINR